MPRILDVGATPLPKALVVNLLLLLNFAVQHSGMARQGFKAAVRAVCLAGHRTLQLCAPREPDAPPPAVLAVATNSDGGLKHPDGFTVKLISISPIGQTASRYVCN